MIRALALAALVLGCGSTPDHPPAQIVDLTTSTAELLRDFDAHSGEPRFVTIIAPS